MRFSALFACPGHTEGRLGAGLRHTIITHDTQNISQQHDPLMRIGSLTIALCASLILKIMKIIKLYLEA